MSQGSGLHAHLDTSDCQNFSFPSLMLYMLPLLGICMFAEVSRNSPMDGSKVKMLVPEPMLSTIQQLLPYMQ